MSDRELIERAAMAAGLEIAAARQAERDEEIGREAAGLWLKDGRTWWNPLTDDGDALRLAVKCGLVWNYFSTDWRCKTGVIEVCVSRSNGPKPVHDEPIRDRSQILAATRRAIVRAAAALAPPQEQQ